MTRGRPDTMKKLNEPTEQEIADRSDKMIKEVNDLSDKMEAGRVGEGRHAFMVYTMRRMARLELLIGQLATLNG